MSLETASLRIIACRVLCIPVQAQCQHKVSRKQLFFSAAMMEEEEVLHVAGKLVFANNTGSNGRALFQRSILVNLNFYFVDEKVTTN